MRFENEVTSANASLEKTLLDMFGDISDESDSEETTTAVVESAPVPSCGSWQTADVERSPCNKRKCEEPDETLRKKGRQVEPDNSGAQETTHPVKSATAPAIGMNVSVCPDSVQSKRSSADGGGGGDVGNVLMTVVMPGPCALDGAGDRQGPQDDAAPEEMFPGYSMDKVDFIVKSMCLPDHDVVVSGKSARIDDVRTVFGYDSWLNDEAISSYMQLIVDRDPGKVYAFNTYFYPILSSCGYQAVQRWKSEKSIFDYNRVLIPVHKNSHWTLMCVDFGDKTIKYYDSLGGKNQQCLELVLDYLKKESCKGKIGQEFHSDEWRLLHADDCPKQLNYNDCGVFTCINAEYLARGVRPNFTQSDMTILRHRMCFEILTDHLLLGTGGSRPRANISMSKTDR